MVLLKLNRMFKVTLTELLGTTVMHVLQIGGLQSLPDNKTQAPPIASTETSKRSDHWNTHPTRSHCQLSLRNMVHPVHCPPPYPAAAGCGDTPFAGAGCGFAAGAVYPV